jgi:hypothetical protein
MFFLGIYYPRVRLHLFEAFYLPCLADLVS